MSSCTHTLAQGGRQRTVELAFPLHFLTRSSTIPARPFEAAWSRGLLTSCVEHAWAMMKHGDHETDSSTTPTPALGEVLVARCWSPEVSSLTASSNGIAKGVRSKTTLNGIWSHTGKVGSPAMRTHHNHW